MAHQNQAELESGHSGKSVQNSQGNSLRWIGQIKQMCFRPDLKDDKELDVRRDISNEFQSLGPITEKQRAPRIVQTCGTMNEGPVEYLVE